MLQRFESKLLASAALIVGISLAPTSARAATLGFADVVLEYFAAGNSPSPLPEPYGSTGRAILEPSENGGFTIEPVSPDVILGPPPPSPVNSRLNPNVDWLALPQGSFVTVGFTNERIVDGPGNDIFIGNLEDSAGEQADIFVSANGNDFEFLGRIGEGGVRELDLATIGFTAPVEAIKIVGIDNFGNSPGFDLVSVEGLPGSIEPRFEPASVPEPTSTLGLLAFGALGADSVLKRKQKQQKLSRSKTFVS
ncbi:PEP-CTERM sorting domain-containing protein [Scytonema sp. UIC 10036]|uniref:PEP-CTERM sorting domain-containing protein n=1 Tax=Scytonema sp. UIC 10036 TaxID=2304196 RepID=UPI001A9B78B3|nr:PEP-CTERM sorting domain-containing protein [Scytonema sp. UIC 10036]